MNTVQVESQNVLMVADALFQTHGFEHTSLSDIATQADIPLELLEREFACKETLALAIYNALSVQSQEQAEEIDTAPISEMYYIVLEQRLSLLADHSEVSSILFANAMRPNAQVTAAEIATGTRDPMMQAIRHIIDNSSNKPRKGSDDLMYFLYAFHFLVIVFWLYDRTEDKAASHMFTGFLRDLLKTLQPMLVLPMISKALTNMAKIMMVVFGGARLVDPKQRKQ